jgi:hypothetical protein
VTLVLDNLLGSGSTKPTLNAEMTFQERRKQQTPKKTNRKCRHTKLRYKFYHIVQDESTRTATVYLSCTICASNKQNKRFIVVALQEANSSRLNHFIRTIHPSPRSSS